jgi:hypothetical protein
MHSIAFQPRDVCLSKPVKSYTGTIYRNIRPCFEQGYDVSTGYRPQIDQQHEIAPALYFGRSSARDLLAGALYRERNRHAAALRRHANTGMQQLITYVSTDEDAQAFGSSSNLRLVPNEAEATVSNNCRSLAASMRDRQISILRGPRVYLKMTLERLANRCHRTIVAK